MRGILFKLPELDLLV